MAAWFGFEQTEQSRNMNGLYHALKTFQRIEREVEQVKEHGGDRKSKEVSNQGDNITLKKEGRGTSPTYALRRLKRDRAKRFQTYCATFLEAAEPPGREYRERTCP